MVNLLVVSALVSSGYAEARVGAHTATPAPVVSTKRRVLFPERPVSASSSTPKPKPMAPSPPVSPAPSKNQKGHTEQPDNTGANPKLGGKVSVVEAPKLGLTTFSGDGEASKRKIASSARSGQGGVGEPIEVTGAKETASKPKPAREVALAGDAKIENQKIPAESPVNADTVVPVQAANAIEGQSTPADASIEAGPDQRNPAASPSDAPIPLFPPGQIKPVQLFPPAVSAEGAPMSLSTEAAQPAAAPLPLPPASAEEHRFLVSRIVYEFGAPGSKPNKRLPPMAKLTQGRVVLGRVKDGLTAPARGEKTEEVAVVGGKPQYYYGDALLALFNGVVERLNKDFGIYGVYVLADQDQIDPVTLEDKRGGKESGLTVRVYVSEVKEVRTIARDVPFGASDQPKINDRKHERIRSKSPIFATSELHGGGLFAKLRLQNYLDRMNRFPGRRVDASLEASGEQGKVILDYLVREQKHFSVYAQTSNTGTSTTGEWRSRLGAEYRQLAGLDDTLRLEYGTTNFKDYQTGLFSYEFTPVFPDYLKLKTYGNWGNYSSSDVGQSLASFSGESLTGGAAATFTPVYVKGFPLDLYAGAEWLNTRVTNSSTGGGSTDFFLPYIGIGTDKTTEKFTLALNAEVQTNVAGVAGTDSGAALDVLGRSGIDSDFTIGKWNLLISFYLEPLLYGKEWDEQKIWWKSTRAHELSLSFRGQVAFDSARLAPQLQFVEGGLYTVRGYPESYSVGDSAMVGSFEYRFHVPRVFKPASQINQKKKPGEAAETAEIPPVDAAKSRGFAFRPSGISNGPDWDLIFRYFVDYGQTLNNAPFPYEPNRSLLGTGVGLELQFFKPVFASARVDWGYSLLGINDASAQRVDRGDSRLNVSFSLAW